jgi:hypothetical protein
VPHKRKSPLIVEAGVVGFQCFCNHLLASLVDARSVGSPALLIAIDKQPSLRSAALFPAFLGAPATKGDI